MRQSVLSTESTMVITLAVAILFGGVRVAQAQTEAPSGTPAETETCEGCHRLSSPALYQQWAESKHQESDVGCSDCHTADEKDPDAFKHEGAWIATIVSPADCAECHEEEAEQFASSRHSRAG